MRLPCLGKRQGVELLLVASTRTWWRPGSILPSLVNSSRLGWGCGPAAHPNFCSAKAWVTQNMHMAFTLLAI